MTLRQLPFYLYRAHVVVRLVKEDGVCHGGDEGAGGGLDEGSHRVPPVTMHQTTLLVGVPRRHGLCNQHREQSGVTEILR